MIKTYNSMDLISQLLKPLQRSLDEVLKIMDRNIDLERVSVIGEDSIEKTSKIQHTLNTDSIDQNENLLKYRSNKYNFPSPDMETKENFSAGIKSILTKTNESVPEIPSQNQLNNSVYTKAKKDKSSNEKFKSEIQKKFQSLSSQIDISNIKTLDRNRYLGNYHGVFLKREFLKEFNNEFSVIKNDFGTTESNNYSEDIITGNEQRKTTEPVEELVPIAENNTRQASAPQINLSPSLDPSSNMKLIGPKKKNNQDIPLDNINSQQFNSVMGIPFKELDSEESKQIQIKSGSDFKSLHYSNEKNRSLDEEHLEERPINTIKRTNIDRKITVPIKKTSNFKMAHTSNEKKRSSQDLEERSINTLKKTNPNIFVDPELEKKGNSSTNSNLYKPNGKIPLTREVKQLANRIVKAVNPVLEQVQTAKFLPNVDENSGYPPRENATELNNEIRENNNVKNTFNVNVAMSADSSTTINNSEILEDALIDILLTSARRQGLEI
ncbi:MAG: hypothetical protein GY714_15170 [Desulfobacterales bacterium]|nr:hypothetical protein [Desulfobacterales bacterium]MCP4162108.1 hypothetical protein [Deltaproteobacteria bacterium]